MNEQQAKELLKKYNDGTATPKERELVEVYYFRYLKGKNTSPDHDRLLKDQAEVRASLQAHIGADQIKILPQRKRWPRIAAAAVVLLSLSYGGYRLLHQPKEQQIAQVQKQDIPPGHNQATLTLSNGRKISLTKNLAGNLARQGNMQIGINGQNALAYAPVTNNTANTVQYNTMSTKVGEQSPYPLVLSDGTQVLLDAKSSITFPVAFNGSERKVSITGKAWFKVNPIQGKPFYVSAKGQLTKEIGTEFVIEAYDDEPAVKTTLVEGSITVNGKLLRPGQQAVNNGSSIILKDADTQEALAWVHGKFRYNDEKLPYIMRELSRWYDIDVQYQGDVSTDGFNGQISRYKNISEVLSMLESTQLVHFKVEGRRITVSR